jgi:hypothetical protein
LPAHAGLGYPDGLGHLRDHVLIVACGNAAQQRVEHALAQRRLVLHRGVSGNLDFLAAALAPGAQAWPFHLDFAIAEHHLARLPAMEDHTRQTALRVCKVVGWSC